MHALHAAGWWPPVGRALVKAREARRKTLIKGRMRTGAAWNDVCILNLSSYGAGLQASLPPPRGTYVEIRRGPYIIVARVAWCDGHRFGVRSQDRLAIDAIIAEPKKAAEPDGRSEDVHVERRAAPRNESRHERNRWVGRMAEFACIALLGAGAAVTLYDAIEQTFARPLSSIATTFRASNS